MAVEVPSAQHRVLIGRGGQHLNELQNKTGTQIQFPGSRSYAQVGEAENAEEFTEVNSADIVKVTGARGAVDAAIMELKVCCFSYRGSNDAYIRSRVRSSPRLPKASLQL
jgi:hypothetical protein